MADVNPEIESRFTKLLLSAVLKTIEAVHDNVDAHETVRKHMLGICAGVRQRALESAGEDAESGQATAHVDALIGMIDEYIDYSANPMFGKIELVRRG
jgi:hypothetical protein